MKLTRRDFVNGVLVGSGAALLGATTGGRANQASTSQIEAHQPPPHARLGEDWYGYGGVGDYAASHGNTPEVVNTAHRLRVKDLAGLANSLPDDEQYDVVIVGGGMAGLGAAWHFKKQARPGQRALLLDNHPLIGGEAKENEFDVDGHTLLAPQGANGFFLPAATKNPESATGDARYYAEFAIPRELPYGDWATGVRPLRICRDNYGYLYWRTEHNTDVGYFFNDDNGGRWVRNIWQRQLQDAPWSPGQRRAMLAWRNSRNEALADGSRDAWLDGMSYKTYLESALQLRPAATATGDLFLAAAFGLGGDAVSAWVAKDVAMPGTLSSAQAEQELPRRQSFPGGNSGFVRYFLKHITPEAIAGKPDFDDIITGRINTAALDQPGKPVRLRPNATAVSVQHASGKRGPVRVVYAHGGRHYAVRTQAVVMASGGWVNRHVVKDLPDDFMHAYLQFNHAPFLVANVALSNWRFLYELGITACRWSDGFAYTCNVRRPMYVGRHRPPLHPDKPIVLTFYIPFYAPGQTVKAQTTQGRAALLHTSYAEYEKQLIDQMNVLFSASGFNAERDIRGIVLNRWGHAYVVPEPGFFFDTDKRTAPRNVIKQGYGRIAFGHSELQGFQHWGPAADEGRRAMQQALSV